MNLLELFLIFAKIGVCTFGGGYAMLPILEREIVDKKGWATTDELMDYYAISQCTPGVIAVNVATFIGKKVYGIAGSIMATLGVVFPSIVIIGIIAAFLGGFADNVYVGHALAGIRVAVCAIVAVSIYKVCKKGLVDVLTWIIAIAVLVLTAVLGLSPVISVVAAALAGIVAKAVTANTVSSDKKAKGGEGK